MVQLEVDSFDWGSRAQVRKRFFEFKWDERAGPALSINFGEKKLGLALLCHRKLERSLAIFGYTIPLCYRCTALLIGFFIGPFD
jgi:hypothetical protein